MSKLMDEYTEDLEAFQIFRDWLEAPDAPAIEGFYVFHQVSARMDLGEFGARLQCKVLGRERLYRAVVRALGAWCREHQGEIRSAILDGLEAYIEQRKTDATNEAIAFLQHPEGQEKSNG